MVGIQNGGPDAVLSNVGLADLDASKLVITLAETLKPLPDPEALVFGQTKTDHMLTVEFDPAVGWKTPHIRPYAKLELDPMSSCFQYCPNIFEGMKAYLGPDGEPRLFRPDKNMERMANSAARMALPPFNTSALLSLLKALVRTEKRWIPTGNGYSLYIRPTLIGTRDALGVTASDKAILYAVVSPTGPYFKKPKIKAGGANGVQPNGAAANASSTTAQKPKGISLLAVSETVRSWPGGTGAYKLGLNYAPGFKPQQDALKKGYDQILWLLGVRGEDGKEEERITEAGAMNLFVVVKREDGDLDVFTPPLDGTILPGLTRDSILALLDAHTTGASSISSSPSSPQNPTMHLPALSPTLKLHTHETPLTMAQLLAWSASGALLEVFGVGTAVVVAPVARIGYQEPGRGVYDNQSTSNNQGLNQDAAKDIVLPSYDIPGANGLGPVGKALSDVIMAIQVGRVDFEGWCVPVV